MPGTVVVNQPSVIAVDSEGNIVTEDIVFFEFVKLVTVVGPSYFIAIDLSNSSGDYPHTETGGINIVRASSFLDKDTANDSWEAGVGVITAINATDATINFVAFLGNSTSKTASFLSVNSLLAYPLTLPLKVVGGELPKVVSNNIVTTTDINTGSSLEDTAGDLIAPAVGDLIVKIERTAGNGNSEYGLGGSYYTVA